MLLVMKVVSPVLQVTCIQLAADHVCMYSATSFYALGSFFS